MTKNQELGLQKDIIRLIRWLQIAIAVGLLAISVFAWQLNSAKDDANKNEERAIKALKTIAAHSVNIEVFK